MFGAIFASLNILIVAVLLTHAIKNRQSFLPLYWIVIIYSTLEAVLFSLIGFIGIFQKFLRSSDSYSEVLIWVLIPWIVMSVVITVLLVVLHDHRTLFEKYVKEQNKKAKVAKILEESIGEVKQ